MKRTDENKKHGREQSHAQIQGHRNKDNDRTISLRPIGTPASAVNYDRTHRDGRQHHTRGQPRKTGREQKNGTRRIETQPRDTFLHACEAQSRLRGEGPPGVLPINATSQNWTVKCGKPPAAGVFTNFACEAARGAGADSPSRACLFNMQADPCEFVDRSNDQPAVLQHMLVRLGVFRGSAVYGPTATHNPDGPDCPAAQTVAGCTGPGSKSPMSCAAKLPCGPRM